MAGSRIVSPTRPTRFPPRSSPRTATACSRSASSPSPAPVPAASTTSAWCGRSEGARRTPGSVQCGMAGRACYHCKQWVEAGEAHDCWSTTERALTQDLSEDLREAWLRLREAASELGEQRIYA